MVEVVIKSEKAVIATAGLLFRLPLIKGIPYEVLVSSI
jgi:hypothetical protein